jgi:hypothetical protein
MPAMPLAVAMIESACLRRESAAARRAAGLDKDRPALRRRHVLSGPRHLKNSPLKWIGWTLV